MSSSHIRDLETLKMIGQRANSLWAFPIKHKTVPWGVIVFDRTGGDPIDFEELMKGHSESYQKIMEFTTQLIR